MSDASTSDPRASSTPGRRPGRSDPALRTEQGDPRTDPRARALFEACFGRGGAEWALVERVAHEHPDFDPRLARLASNDAGPVGWGLFLPRTLRLAQRWVPVVVSAPICVHPAHRGRGVARALLDDGLARARERGAVAAVALGAADVYRRVGYAPAFRRHSLRVRADELPDADRTGWRGLEPTDLRPLAELHAAAAEGGREPGAPADDAGDDAGDGAGDGAERRRPVPLEWESQVADGHTRVAVVEGELRALVRYRFDRGLADAGLEVTEVAVHGVDDVARVLAFLRALLADHGRETLELRAPPSHPVARALFHRGALALATDLGGAAQLAVLDWLALLRATAATWEQRLAAGDGRPLSLGIGDEDLWLYASPLELMLERRRDPRRHLHVPADLAPSLVTGHRSWRDLAERREVHDRSRLDASGWRAVRALFPDGEPDWRWGPVFELADR